MFNRKILLALIVVILLNGCTSPSAMIGPVYTLSSTGNTFQAGLSYGSNELITQYTGKTPIENLTELRVIEENETCCLGYFSSGSWIGSTYERVQDSFA
mgnify:CR=1 FL=1